MRSGRRPIKYGENRLASPGAPAAAAEGTASWRRSSRSTDRAAGQPLSSARPGRATVLPRTAQCVHRRSRGPKVLATSRTVRYPHRPGLQRVVEHLPSTSHKGKRCTSRSTSLGDVRRSNGPAHGRGPTARSGQRHSGGGKGCQSIARQGRPQPLGFLQYRLILPSSTQIRLSPVAGTSSLGSSPASSGIIFSPSMLSGCSSPGIWLFRLPTTRSSV
jgi:hypothetical protein